MIWKVETRGDSKEAITAMTLAMAHIWKTHKIQFNWEVWRTQCIMPGLPNSNFFQAKILPHSFDDAAREAEQVALNNPIEFCSIHFNLPPAVQPSDIVLQMDY